MLEGRRGAALGLVLFLGLGAFGISTEISSQHRIQDTAAHKTNKRAKTNIDPRTADERIADYTLWLERFTGLLAILSFIQIAFLFSADRTARITADAAKAAADAAMAALDRPWLYIETPVIGKISLPVWKERLLATLCFTNHGKAPALILSAKATLFCSPGPFLGDAFPVRPLPTTMRDFPAAHSVGLFVYTSSQDILQKDENNYLHPVNTQVVVASQTTSSEYFFRGESIIDLSGGGLPVEYTGYIYLIGHVIYKSPNSEREVVAFCYEATTSIGPFKSIYGAPYNERRKISKHENQKS